MTRYNYLLISLLLAFAFNCFACEESYLNEYEIFDITTIHLQNTELSRVESVIKKFHQEHTETTTYKSYVGAALNYLEKYEDLNGKQKAYIWYELINPLVVKYSFEN